MTSAISQAGFAAPPPPLPPLAAAVTVNCCDVVEVAPFASVITSCTLVVPVFRPVMTMLLPVVALSDTTASLPGKDHA